MIQNMSAAGAKSYYSSADYYTEGQELVGIWRGEGAARLGLSGKVEQPAWDALCDGHDPNTGLPLTVRRKQERTVGYDLNWHPPKSVSVLYAMTGDDRILNAFRESVGETMLDIESEMKTRVRKEGVNEDRTTHNMVWGEFVHFTSRPVDGIPDPHIHIHAFVQNLTVDDQENRWKAGQFREIKRDAPFFEAKFHSRLARRMQELGLPIERTKNGWEIEGFGKSTLDKFARRRAQIEETARALEEQARKDGKDISVETFDLGATTRERKQKHLSMAELRREWRSRLTSDEGTALSKVVARIGTEAIPESVGHAREAAALAADHIFERKSVAAERELLTEAMRRSVGVASPELVSQTVDEQNLIRADRDGRRLVTTSEVLAEERRMIAFARDGRGTCQRLGRDAHVFRRDWLNADQRRAVRHVTDSPDRVILIRGAAGTGKTAMMSEAVEAIEARGNKVFAFAPTADASRGVLREEGFENADTVARLLADERLQEQVKNNVIWIDEAGLLGGRTMAGVFDIADRLDARVILSGDRRQHGSVERGAALRLLETEAGLVPAEIREIKRQSGEYRQAIHALSEGRTEDGFAQLDKLGWIREVEDGERHKALANDYVAAIRNKKSALVVSPTHLEGRQITDEIRLQLKADRRLAADERQLTIWRNAHLTRGQRADEVNYVPSDMIEFHQNAPGHRKGDRLVAGDEPLPLGHASRFQTYRADTISLAPGDIIRVTKNGMTADKRHRLNNGSRYIVKGFDRDGDMMLDNGWTVAKNWGHFTHGYVVTSHASQGKTVDRVFIGQGSESFPASSREQFYVSVSRGRQQAVVYTDDKELLLEAVRRSDERLSATEFVSERDMRERGVTIQRLERVSEPEQERGNQTREREEVTYER